LLILVVCIFATDFLDGYVSRKGKEVTKAERMMDSASDYSLLIVLSVVFRYYKIIPAWFLILVLVRLGIQTLLMAILIIVQKRIEPTSTFMGKVAVASIMIVYSVELVILLIGSVPRPVKNGIEWIAAAILTASIGDKILSFARSMGCVGPSGGYRMAMIKSALELALERTKDLKIDEAALEASNIKTEGRRAAGNIWRTSDSTIWPRR
jgi:phosphatidylglycerophosphate synthase